MHGTYYMGSDKESHTASSNEEQQLGSLRLSAVIEKERVNEVQYIGLYTTLLQRHLQTLRHGFTHNPTAQEYSHESSIIKKAIAIERKAWVSGLVVGCIVFVSVRKLPYWLTKWIGGDAKLQAMHRADIEAAKLPNAHLKRMGSFLFEGTFTFWAGWRAYHAAISMQSDGEIYDELAQIPLSPGKSRVSEALCKDWINITNDVIPSEFWHNLNQAETNMKNQQLLRAIYAFSGNCMKRERYESLLSKHHKEVYIPNPGVPNHVLEMSADEVEKILKAQ